MSFDQYFEHTEKQVLHNDDSDDWYGIVEEALYAADLASSRHRQQLEVNLMKPLPMIPEDAVEEPLIVESIYDLTRRPSSVYSAEEQITPLNETKRSNEAPASARRLRLQIPATKANARRPSSVHSIDFDSPTSPESSALHSWASSICDIKEGASSSLRSKPFTRQSSSTGSATSAWSASSIGSSVMASRTRSISSSIYSTDTSVDGGGNSAKSICMHSRDASTNSAISSKKVRFEETALTSFFDFSDDEEEEQEEVTVSRPESSASNYVRHLRKKALSLRIATSKMTQGQVKMSSLHVSPIETPILSGWLYRSSSMDRVSSTTATSDASGLEGQLMAGAAHSAKARRVLGLK